jgi:predicted nucleotidyltransferase
MAPIREQIEESLDLIEREEQCAVLLAVESGSRAWGFESRDSDYDVRFIYVRPVEWYLSVDEDKRDVIEKPITGELDVSGWDLRKALRLLRKSNPPLLEWLQSPIVYRQRPDIADGLRALAPEFYNARAGFFHYLHMAEGNLREYLRGDTVWRKKYFYVLRPVLAMRWIEQGRGLVPIEFQTLLDAAVPAGEIRGAIDDLLAAKRAGAELDRGPRVPVISDFVEAEIARLAQQGSAQPVSRGNPSELDRYFISVLGSVWGSATTCQS